MTSTTTALAKRESKRREAIARGMKGNVNAGKRSWSVFLKAGKALEPRDRALLAAGRKLAVELVEALGGQDDLTPQRALLVTSATRLSVAADLATRELFEAGAFVDGKNGRQEAPSLAALVRLTGELRQVLSALGLERRARPARTLAERMKQLTEGTAKESDPIPAESRVIEAETTA